MMSVTKDRAISDTFENIAWSFRDTGIQWVLWIPVQPVILLEYFSRCFYLVIRYTGAYWFEKWKFNILIK